MLGGSLQGFILLAMGRGFQVLAGLVTIKVVTTILSPGELGTVNQVMSLAVFGASVVLTPVATYIWRGFFEWLDADTLRERLRSYLLFVSLVSMAFGLGVWTIQDQTSFVSGIGAVWVGFLVALYVFGFSTHTMAASGLNLLGHRLLYVSFGNIAVWGGLVLAVYLSRAGIGPETWLLGIYGGFLLASTSYLFLYRYASSSRYCGLDLGARETISFDQWKMFMFAWPQVISNGLWWVQSQSYRFILNWIDNIASVGLFAMGYMICSVPIQTFETLFNEYYSPTLYRALKAQDAAGIARAWEAYARAYLPAVILFGSFMAGNAAFLAKLLLGEQFQSVAPILIWPALTETMRASLSSLHTLGVAKVDMTISLPPVIAGALAAPILVLILATHDALLGTAIALLGAGAVALIVGIYVNYRTLPITWPMRRIAIAIALSLPLILMGHILNAVLGDLTDDKAGMALAISALAMLLLQYAMAKDWIHQMRPAEAEATV
ncbi:MAG TPA: oligosaccharide flippase family protein [Nitrospira sp.]|nr:oligosaccharide flippase family protein [Nitrospira sp.]